MENKYIALLNNEFCNNFHKNILNIKKDENNDNIKTNFNGFNDFGQGMLKVSNQHNTIFNLMVDDYACKGVDCKGENFDFTKEWVAFMANQLESIDNRNGSHFYIDYISRFKLCREEHKQKEIEKARQKCDVETNEILEYMKRFMIEQ